MPIAEIIHQIDAYLFSLRQARELLSAPIKEVPPERTPSQKREIKIHKRTAAASTTPRVQKQKSRPAISTVERSTKKERVRIDPPSQIRSSMAPQAANPGRQLHVEDEKSTPVAAVNPEPNISTEPPTPPNQVTRARRLRRPTPKPPARPKSEIVKPAIALAGSMNSRIVVVSAEQARQERNRTAPAPEVRRPRLPSTGLHGKLAFEALFKDSSDPSTSSGQ